MSRAVLYANSDMEPITVLDVPDKYMERMMDRERIFFALPSVTELISLRGEQEIPMLQGHVCIWGDMFIRHGQRHLMLFTDNDEMALLLRADFLPGQHGRLQQEYRRGVSDGFVKALRMMGDAS